MICVRIPFWVPVCWDSRERPRCRRYAEEQGRWIVRQYVYHPRDLRLLGSLEMPPSLLGYGHCLPAYRVRWKPTRCREWGMRDTGRVGNRRWKQGKEVERRQYLPFCRSFYGYQSCSAPPPESELGLLVTAIRRGSSLSWSLRFHDPQGALQRAWSEEKCPKRYYELLPDLLVLWKEASDWLIGEESPITTMACPCTPYLFLGPSAIRDALSWECRHCVSWILREVPCPGIATLDTGTRSA